MVVVVNTAKIFKCVAVLELMELYGIKILFSPYFVYDANPISEIFNEMEYELQRMPYNYLEDYRGRDHRQNCLKAMTQKSVAYVNKCILSSPHITHSTIK